MCKQPRVPQSPTCRSPAHLYCIPHTSLRVPCCTPQKKYARVCDPVRGPGPHGIRALGHINANPANNGAGAADSSHLQYNICRYHCQAPCKRHHFTFQMIAGDPVRVLRRLPESTTIPFSDSSQRRGRSVFGSIFKRTHSSSSVHGMNARKAEILIRS